MGRIGVKQPSDHALVLCVMFPSFALKKLHTSFAQSNGDFDSLIAKDEFLRARKEVRYDLEVPEWLVGVLDFPAHMFACLSANIQPRKFEPHDSET